MTCKQSGMDYICVVSTQRTFHEHPNAYTVSIKVIRFSSLSGALVSEYWYAGMILYSCVGGVAGRPEDTRCYMKCMTMYQILTFTEL